MTLNDIGSNSGSAHIATQPHVVVTQGEATVKRAPDQAWLSIATETRDTKPDEARRKSAESMTAIQTTLRTTGLSTNAIRTTGYWLAPEMEWKNGHGTVKGYIVHNQIEILIDNLNLLSDVIDAVNATRNTSLIISGLRFALKDQNAAESEALKLAVQAALARANAIATGAQLTLGEIIRIEEQYFGGVHRAEPLMMRKTMVQASESSETPIISGDIEFRVQVILTAELR
jgi:uncharacterized protein